MVRAVGSKEKSGAVRGLALSPFWTSGNVPVVLFLTRVPEPVPSMLIILSLPLFYSLCRLPDVHNDDPARVIPIDLVAPGHENLRPNDLIVEKAVENERVGRAIVRDESPEMTSQVTSVVEGCDLVEIIASDNLGARV
jgi:hypothetical protein